MQVTSSTPPPAAPSGGPDIGKLRDLVARLRAPDGCPWDRAQTLGDLRRYLLEEAHEAAAAIDSTLRGGESAELRAELGDLLFQIVFIARLAEEDGTFDLREVIDAIHDKMVDRHPHVFEPGPRLADAGAVHQAWERRKQSTERRGRSVLEGVPDSLPSLVAAHRMTEKAAGVGFDWPDLEGVLAKVKEELAETEEVLAEPAGRTGERRAEEVGDLLFAVANLARHLGVDPEAALHGANRKFRRRFRAIEETFERDGRELAAASLEEMDTVWNVAKSKGL